MKRNCEDCSCDKIDIETSRTKMNHAIQGLKEAIQRHNSGNGTTIKSGDRTYVNCHKAHGKKLFVIIKYAVSLPEIGEEAQEIWRNVRGASNVITRRDLVRISRSADTQKGLRTAFLSSTIEPCTAPTLNSIDSQKCRSGMK